MRAVLTVIYKGYEGSVKQIFFFLFLFNFGQIHNKLDLISFFCPPLAEENDIRSNVVFSNERKVTKIKNSFYPP